MFGDPLSLTVPDPDRSEGEQRFLTIGQSFRARVVVVAHTDRADTSRIINARPATRRARRHYEEES